MIFLFFFEIPSAVATGQIKYQTQHLLDTHNAYKLGYDTDSVNYLKHHPTLKLTDVSDSQGNTPQLEYHLGSTRNGQRLGIEVVREYPDALYSKITIHSIRVWSNQAK